MLFTMRALIMHTLELGKANANIRIPFLKVAKTEALTGSISRELWYRHSPTRNGWGRSKQLSRKCEQNP